MKLTPGSCACATIAFEVAASVRSPNIIVPRQTTETSSPLLPRLRNCIANAHIEGMSVIVQQTMRRCNPPRCRVLVTPFVNGAPETTTERKREYVRSDFALG